MSVALMGINQKRVDLMGVDLIGLNKKSRLHAN